MRKILLGATILVVLFLIPKIVFGNVVINEVFYDPTGTDTGLEYIILYNNADSPYSLTNYCLYASTEHYIFGSFSLGAKEKIIIHWNADGTNTSTDLYTGTTGWSNMGNSSGSVALFLNHDLHNSSNILDFVQYIKKETWESAAVSAGIWTVGTFIPNVSTPGKAIKLKTDGVDNNSPSDWTEAEPSIIQEEPEQTPEQPEIPLIPTTNNPPIADAGDNIIGFVNQEIKFDGSKSSDPESNELHYEWNMGNGKLMETPSFTYIYAFPCTYLVTLMVDDGRNYASDTITVKIQQAQITINEFMANPIGKDEEEEWIEIYNDADSITDISGWQLDDMASGSEPFTLPQNTLIAPKSYLVFSRQVTKITLNNDQDSVRLLLPDGIVFQEINYEKPPQGKSSARTSDGFVWSEPTPGMANIVGLAVKSEKQTVYQQNSVETQIVKESSKNYVINLPNNEILGGYTDMSSNEPAFIPSNGTSAGELARIKTSTTQNPVNLALIIITIVFAAGFLGLLLIKFRRKDLAP